MEFDEVVAEDFTSFKPGVVATHIKIEQTLSDIAGGGTKGAEFKREALKLAGWKYGPLTGYAKNPQLAAEAFNTVRELLGSTQDKDALVEQLKARS